MYPKKILLNTTFFILFISGINGFLIEEGLLGINKSFLNFALDLALVVVATFSIQNTKQIRQLLIVFLSFLILTITTFLANIDELSTSVYLNGIREFIPYFLFPIIFLNLFNSPYRIELIKKFNLFLYIFLALQIPVALYQFSFEGAGDLVGGTQGTGFSGILTFIIFLSTYYLTIQGFDENDIIRSLAKKSYLLIFWLPSFINETKISYFLIALYFLLLIKLSIKNLPKYIYIFLLLIPLLLFYNSIYQNTTETFDSNDFLTGDFFEEYLSSDNENYVDIPRFQKIIILASEFKFEEMILGKGVGQFKGGTTLSLTPFATKYDWLLHGSVPMLFFLLVQVGIIGVIIFVFYWIKLISLRPKTGTINYSGNILVFVTACFVFIQFYNDAFRFLFFCGITMFIMCYAVSARVATNKTLPKIN